MSRIVLVGLALVTVVCGGCGSKEEDISGGEPISRAEQERVQSEAYTPEEAERLKKPR